MRKIGAGLFISLDGVTESPETWQSEYFDADMLADLSAQIAAEDTILLGRRTYEEWQRFWPSATVEPYASHINNAPKYVVSTALDHVEWGQWNNVTLLDGSFDEAIRRLKQQPGKNIGVGGSPTLVRSLLQHDLLDELRLALNPVVIGRGSRLFEGQNDLKKMRLVDCKRTGTGVVLLTYEPAPKS